MAKHKSRRHKRRRPPPGSIPGTLAIDPAAAPSHFRIFAYNADTYIEQDLTDLAELPALVAQWSVTWVDVCGLGDEAKLRQLATLFGYHELALADVVHAHQRGKVDDFGDYIFIVARTITPHQQLRTEQISLLLAQNLIITFQETVGDYFDPIRDRIRSGRGRVRQAGTDYLAYALLDVVVDTYFPILEAYGDRLEAIEEQLLDGTVPNSVADLHSIKRELFVLRRTIWPHRDSLSALSRDGHALIKHATQLYLRDCYDHTIQVMELVEEYREITSALVELYLTTVSNRTNEVMKVLTIIATIFLPVGVIAGIYGMNFNTGQSPLNMPELNWYFGYPFALSLMAAVAVGMLTFFYRKGWLGNRGH